MDIEVDHNQSLKNMMGEYGRDVENVRSNAISDITEDLSQIREKEEHFVKELTAALKIFYVNYTQGIVPDGFEASNALLQIMPDIDTFTSNAVTIHDTLLLKIDSKEDEINTLQATLINTTSNDRKVFEVQRHRSAVHEIRAYLDKTQNEIENLRDTILDLQDEDDVENASQSHSSY